MTAQPDRPEPEQDENEATARPSAETDETANGESESQPAGEPAGPEALQALADQNWEKFLRAAAELENVRKRAARDVEHARRFALEKFSGDLLAVRDSLEMGLESAEKTDVESLLAGSEATLKLLATTMERFGVIEIDPEGEPFDPEQHEAMTMQPSDDVEPGTVIQVFQKGYSLNGRLLRPARVVVAQAAAGDAEKS